MNSDAMPAVVAAVVRELGASGWLVGGSVRDRERGRFFPDIDVVVTGDAHAVARGLSRALDLPWFALSQEHGAYRVVGETAHVDISPVRGGGILDDLGGRDFTINAMAVPLEGGGLIDPFGGLADLRERRLRAVSDHIFDADPLRLMRAARFAGDHRRYDAVDPTPELLRLIRAKAHLLWQAAAERITSELLLTLDAGGSSRWSEFGLMDHLFPEIAEHGVPLESPLGNCLEGTLGCVCKELPFLGVDELLGERLSLAVDGAVVSRTALELARILWGLPLTDIQAVAHRLKLSRSLASFLETTSVMSRWRTAGLGCTPEHGLWTALPQYERRSVSAEDPPGRAAVLFLWEAAPWEPEAIVMAAAAGPLVSGVDALGDCVPSAGLTIARHLLYFWARREVSGIPRLPFDGNDLMTELGLTPGPLLGKALRSAQLAWEAGEATTADQALAVARAAFTGA